MSLAPADVFLVSTYPLGRPHAPRPERKTLVTGGARSVIVLLVDDMLEIREMYSRYLRFAGLGVSTAGDGIEALDVAGLCPPDVIVLDLSMPRLGGWQTLEQIRGDSRLKDVPVIVISAYGKPETPQIAKNAGADAYLEKPCLPSRLLDEIRRVTRGPRPIS